LREKVLIVLMPILFAQTARADNRIVDDLRVGMAKYRHAIYPNVRDRMDRRNVVRNSSCNHGTSIRLQGPDARLLIRDARTIDARDAPSLSPSRWHRLKHMEP